MKDWRTITVGEFRDLYLKEKEALTELDIEAIRIAFLEGITLDELDQMSIGQVNELRRKHEGFFEQFPDVKPASYFKLKGKRYRVIYDVSQINYGQYNEIAHFGQGEASIITNLHLIAATICHPQRRTWYGWWRDEKKDHQRNAEEMLEAPFIVVYHACVFFCKLYLLCLKTMKPYLVGQLSQTTRISAQEATNQLTALIDILDGWLPPSALRISRT